MENKNKKCILIGITILITILTFVGIFTIKRNKQEEIPILKFTEFNTMAKEGKVKKVNLSFSNENLKFEDKDGKIYQTDNPKSKDFKLYLLNMGIDVEEVKSNSALRDVLTSALMTFVSIGSLLLILGIFSKQLLMPSEKYTPSKSVTKFTDIAGNEESKEDMQFLVKFLKEPKKYTDMGAKLPKGVIFYGSPGTGKTLTAKAIAGEAGVPFFSAAGSDFIEMYAGLGAKRIRDLFEEAQKNAPCIVFIDEIDALGSVRGEVGSSEKDQTINALLSELDGFDTESGVIVMAATNRIQDLDPALIRPGRFDRHIAIELPDYKDRLGILKLHSANKNLAEDVDLDSLAKLTMGFSGAGLASLLNEATIEAVNRDSTIVGKEDIDEAYYKIVVKGNKKKNRDRDVEEHELIAYHEAGHALLGKLLTDNDIPKVTIVPSTSGFGGATFNVPKKLGLYTKEELENEVVVLYGGRASEEILKGNDSEITTGASNDIEEATKILRGYFNVYGMSDKYGMIDVTQFKDNNTLTDVVEMSKTLYEKTMTILKENRDTLDNIAKTLIEKETISGDDLNRIIEESKNKKTNI